MRFKRLLLAYLEALFQGRGPDSRARREALLKAYFSGADRDL